MADHAHQLDQLVHVGIELRILEVQREVAGTLDQGEVSRRTPQALLDDLERLSKAAAIDQRVRLALYVLEEGARILAVRDGKVKLVELARGECRVGTAEARRQQL